MSSVFFSLMGRHSDARYGTINIRMIQKLEAEILENDTRME